jgi:hypothetical protein
VLFELGLADELAQVARPEPDLFDDVVAVERFGVEQFLAHGYRRT